jgi:hypothetical protein
MPDSGIADGASFTSAFYDDYIREQVVATCTSGTRPTGVEGRLIFETDTNKLKVYNGSTWEDIYMAGATGTYTPTLTGMAIGTGGSAYNSATYTLVPGHLIVQGRLVFGTTGVTLPTASAIGVGPPSGVTLAPLVAALIPAGICYMTAAGTGYVGSVRAESSSLMRFLATGAAVTYTTTTATSGTIPGTWANGDSISYQFTVPATY